MSKLLKTYRPFDIDIESGQGSVLKDKAGNTYLDMQSGIGVNALGYNHPAIIHAIETQARRHLHISNVFESDAVKSYASALSDHTGYDKVFFANSGAEANEAALKLARKRGRSVHPDKTTIIAVEKGFHGRTSGSMALTGTPRYKAAFAPGLPGVRHVAFNDADGLSEAFDETVCAVFVEVIQGEAGVRPITNAFAQSIQSHALAHDALVVVDEVQTGLMRTGSMLASDDLPFTPNIITLAKALGGGIPLGAMLVDAMGDGVFEPGDHGSTFGGNPLACASGHALLKTITAPSFQSAVQHKATVLWHGLKQLQSRYPQSIRDIRGRGLMVGVELTYDALPLRCHALDKNLILNVTAGNVIRLLPPLTIEKTEIEWFLNTFESLLATA